jgi:hypothetical protein
MSVQGPSSSSIRPFPELRPVRPAAPASPAAASGSAPEAHAGAAAPAPQSTLWQLLTEDERAFFTQQAALGSATYRPSRNAVPQQQPGAPTGQRIDVRA